MVVRAAFYQGPYFGIKCVKNAHFNDEFVDICLTKRQYGVKVPLADQLGQKGFVSGLAPTLSLDFLCFLDLDLDPDSEGPDLVLL